MFNKIHIKGSDINYRKNVSSVHVQCVMCDELNTVHLLTPKEFENFRKWFNNEGLIQELLPNLTPADRELLISGTCSKCWDSMFGGDYNE